MKIQASDFNFWCRGFACLWLLLFIPFNDILRPSSGDFVQFYMGGLISRAQQWDDLYPIPHPDSNSNAGNALDSNAKPGFTRLANQYGLEVGYHFIQPPPVALLLWPLSFLDWEVAHWIWVMLCMVCAMVIALQSGWIAEICFGQSTKAAGIVTLLVALNATTYRSVRAANVTPMMAALLGWVVIDLLRRREVGAIVGVVLSTLLKYAGAIFLPIFIVMHRWKTMVLSALLTAIICGGTVWSGGGATFKEFFVVIFPTLSRSRPELGNQSIEGLLVRITHRMPIEPSLQMALSVGRWLTVAAVLMLILRAAAGIRRSPQMLCASCAAMLAWLLLFSPICWGDYLVYLMPLWGWLAWEAIQGGWRRVVSPFTILLALFNSYFYPRTRMPEPFNSHLTLSLLLTLGLAMARLISGEPQTESGGKRDDEPSCDQRIGV